MFLPYVQFNPLERALLYLFACARVHLCVCVQYRYVGACVFPQWGQKRKEQYSFLLFSDFGLAGLLASL